MIEDSSVSAHLRWYLANSIFRQATANGNDSGRVVFLSIHADSLHPSLRGAMVYIPGAEYRGGSYRKSGSVYAKRLEVREQPQVSFARKDLIRSEGVSRELAQQILGAFHSSGLAVHEYKPIREKIIRNRRSWVPAVLRYNTVPAKALLEVCNLANKEDRRLIQQQQHRQRLAEAIFRGILGFYGDEAAAMSRIVAGP
jgi:N-acetylmuramoyl-L-alanine amidase